MKISICIPQYNRSELLIKSLKNIEKQTYPEIEISISDDCSTDNTQEEIRILKESYKYPIIYYRFQNNQGYDRNYRKCIEISSGEYCFVLGNDDTLNGEDSIEKLVTFLKKNNYPDIGYVNYIEFESNKIFRRAKDTKVQGSGIDIAIRHTNSFSFVGGLVYKKSSFEKFNTDAHDGSIYAQMYLGLLMVASGCTLFTISEPIVMKDIKGETGTQAWSFYKHNLPKNWSEYRVLDGGMHSVCFVLISAIEEALKTVDKNLANKIVRRVYSVTYPYWIVQYKSYGSLPAAIGLIDGMIPAKSRVWNKIQFHHKISIYAIYIFSSVGGIIVPKFIFNSLESVARKWVRRNN